MKPMQPIFCKVFNNVVPILTETFVGTSESRTTRRLDADRDDLKNRRRSLHFAQGGKYAK